MDDVSAPPQPALRIRGSRGGLLITIETDDFAAFSPALAQELQQSNGFFAGSQVTLDAGTRALSRVQIVTVQALLEAQQLELWTVLSTDENTREAARALELATRLSGSDTDLNGHRLPADAPGAPPAVAPPLPLFVRETVRSGRSINHGGPVTILGDVNPGAHVIAHGDVIVWGRLRGLVHAGAAGDETAVIAALHLAPTQLRIGQQIAIAPDDGGAPAQPEMARVRNGQIIVEAWQ